MGAFHWVERLNQLVWGLPALLFLGGIGLLYTIGTGFLQFRKLGYSLREVIRSLRTPQENGVSPFQALCTALGATVGTGNIAGVAGAISIGGPGAMFWMWIAAFLGMALKYGEVVLAVRYRVPGKDGTYRGGPMYYIRQGLPKQFHFLGVLYSIFGVIAAFGVGSAVQINTASSSIREVIPLLGLPESRLWDWVLGVLMGVFVLIIALGGAKRICSAAELLIPAVCLGYVFLSLGAIAANREALPGAIASIFRGAFSPRACTGGIIGSAFTAIQIGVSRGVFTNEAGMGTASIAHANSCISSPVQQGLYGFFEVFADTIVICTMTALVILTAPISIDYGVPAGAELTLSAFSSVYGPWIAVVLALSVALLAFATVLGWGLYGMRCAEFLFGDDLCRWFTPLHALTSVLGAVCSPALIWTLSEAINGLMAIPNLIAMGLLCPEVFRLTKFFFVSRKLKNDNRRY